MNDCPCLAPNQVNDLSSQERWNFSEIDILLTVTVWSEWRVLGGQIGSKSTHFIHRSNYVFQLCEKYIYTPADLVPISTDATKLQRLWRFVCGRSSDANRQNIGVTERENYVSRSDFTHELVEGIYVPIGLHLWGPQIPSRHFVPKSLVLIYPPVAHIGRLTLQES